ncbi:hypothetical protein [Mesorhizobium xinjiangense]|uniref:hypothetical protein n=1 Tax=Mesorhizobium xinjiangense TaxID=2678685 RepID=UPI0012EE7088|nr:hypothetical protein [Mesorhizobium xinjiangense]
MPETNGLSQRWEQYRPTKSVWLWSVVGAAVATVLIGFTAGGWTTGGSAKLMAAQSARDAKAELAATFCVERFVTADGADKHFAELKEASSWQRDDFIEDGGWVKFAGIEDAIPGASERCAGEIAAMDELPVKQVEAPAQPSEG